MIERAAEWGISVKAVEGNDRYYGYYSQALNEIVLATESEYVFFHELSHAAHARITGYRKCESAAIREIVAELSAYALTKLVGVDLRDYFQNFSRYTAKYAHELHMTPQQACVKVISDVEKILNLILGETQ